MAVREAAAEWTVVVGVLRAVVIVARGEEETAKAVAARASEEAVLAMAMETGVVEAARGEVEVARGMEEAAKAEVARAMAAAERERAAAERAKERTAKVLPAVGAGEATTAAARRSPRSEESST